jgi:heme exporter protein CcmB
LLDEPEAALDAATRDKLEWIFETHAGDSGIIFATHDLASATELAERALVLNRGSLVGEFAVRPNDADGLQERVATALNASTRIGPGTGMRIENRSNGQVTNAGVRIGRRVDTLRQMAAVFRKDVRLELRTREVIPALTVLSLLIVIAFSLAFVVPADDVPAVAAGVLWASLVFGTLVGGLRSFQAERDEGTMEALVLSPVLRAGIYLAKTGVNFVFLTVVGLLTMVGVAVLFDVGLIRWEMVGLLLLGAAAFSSTGSLYGAVTASIRARELLIPILLLPVALPVLIAGVAATLAILDVTSDASQFPWVGLLAGFCAIFASVGAILFDHVLGE